MDPLLEAEHLRNRKKLYILSNQLLDIQRQIRITSAKYKWDKLENSVASSEKQSSFDKVFAFDTSGPLQNEYILEMISTYLPSQDLRNCRLVCRLWSKEMSRSLQARRHNLIVTESEDCPEAISILQNAKKTSVVALGGICFFGVAPSCSLYKRLMAQFGCTLSSLKFEECQLSAQDLATILTRQAPHLESFSYKDRALPESQRVSTFAKIKSLIINLPEQKIANFPELKRLQWDEEFGKVELEEIIAMCPNLIELIYKNSPIPTTPNYRKLRWDSLKTLRISPRDELRNEHVISLTSLKLKINRLTIFGINPKEKERMKNLGKFLKSISNTLTDLELFQHYTIEDGFNPLYESPFFVDASSSTSSFNLLLPHLKRLNLDFCLLKSAKALSYLPQLKVLECRAKTCTDWEAVGKKGFPLKEKNHNLNRLHLGSINSKYLFKFANSFSSCTCLELFPQHVTDAAMRVIIRGFPQLEQLRIAKMRERFGGSSSHKLPLTDTGLSGLDVSTCKRLCESANMMITTNDFSKEQTYPAIHQLKELTRLEILAHESSSFLTDISVVYGIAKCLKLNILSLSICDLSDVSLKAIQDNLKLALLDLPKCPKFSDSALSDLRNKHKDMTLQSGILGCLYEND